MSRNYSEFSGSLIVTGSVTASLGFYGLTTTLSGSSQVDHDATTNFVVNEHIDHSAVSITGTGGVTGGGDITTSRALTLNTSDSQFTGGVLNYINTLGVLSGSNADHATTGSNIFSGSQNITGSLILTGSAEIDGLLTVLGTGTSQFTSHLQSHCLGIGTSPSGVSGEIRATGDITAYYSSDERLKADIKPILNATDKLKKIQGVEFNWIPREDIHSNEGHDIGVIAQEVEKVLPELVITRKNGYKAVKYDKLVALLIQSNKELLERVEKLESK